MSNAVCASGIDSDASFYVSPALEIVNNKCNWIDASVPAQYFHPDNRRFGTPPLELPKIKHGITFDRYHHEHGVEYIDGNITVQITDVSRRTGDDQIEILLM